MPVMLMITLVAHLGPQQGPVVVVGTFSNIRYTSEHANGEAVQVWRRGNRLVGLFMFTDGRQADFHTGILEHLRFNPTTGELSFDAYASQFHFDGRLEKTTVKGLLKRMQAETGRQIDENQVILKRDADFTHSMRAYSSEEEWNRYAAEEVRRLGPHGKS
jgi:hypothetical protein